MIEVIISNLLGLVIQNIIAQLVTKSESKKHEAAKTVIISCIVGIALIVLAIR